MIKKNIRRKDKKGIVLKDGESQRKNGTYDYRYMTKDGKRHAIYAKSLNELREKENQLILDSDAGLKPSDKRKTINDIYHLFVELKKGVKDNTMRNYCYMYERFVEPDFGNMRLCDLKKTDVRRFYNRLADERLLKIRSIENIHTVLYQVFELAVEEGYLKTNLSTNCIGDLKKSHNYEQPKKFALTMDEQLLFEQFLENSRQYNHWQPIFIVMLYTGMRVGEVTGLRWSDIDFEKNEINVNHTLVYYSHEKNGCGFSVNSPKTPNSYRSIPMVKKVRDALLKQKENMDILESRGVNLNKVIDGYTNFVFINRNGNLQNPTLLNKTLFRIMRDCNDEVLEKSFDENGDITLLPRFSCHNLRHTFATRLIEKGTNLKVAQDVLGHTDIRTTMNIYVDATNDLKNREMQKFETLMDFE